MNTSLQSKVYKLDLDATAISLLTFFYLRFLTIDVGKGFDTTSARIVDFLNNFYS